MGGDGQVVEDMQIICPAVTCRASNDISATACIKCGLPLGEYAKLMLYSSKLFNMGLVSVKENRMNRARDFFASVVYWCPMDLEARNALAMTCYALGDVLEARQHWEAVLKQSPSDSIAEQGLSLIRKLAAKSAKKKIGTYKKKRGKKKVFGKKHKKKNNNRSDSNSKTIVPT